MLADLQAERYFAVACDGFQVQAPNFHLELTVVANQNLDVAVLFSSEAIAAVGTVTPMEETIAILMLVVCVMLVTDQ